MNLQQILGSGTSKISDQLGGGSELGQDDFMRLLVAQMKNQDPTNPADNSEFLSQIAQFNMVSGIDDLGKSFNGIASTLYSAQAMQAAGLVGREVLTESATAIVQTGLPVSGVMDFDNSASAVSLTIRNAAGEMVDVVDLGIAQPGSRNFSWQGTDFNGDQVAPGQYSFQVEGFSNGQQLGVPVRMFNTVDSVSVNKTNSTIQLHLNSGESVGLSQISEYK